MCNCCFPWLHKPLQCHQLAVNSQFLPLEHSVYLVYIVCILSKTRGQKIYSKTDWSKSCKTICKANTHCNRISNSKILLKRGINMSLLDIFSISTLKLHLEQEAWKSPYNSKWQEWKCSYLPFFVFFSPNFAFLQAI